MAHDEDICCPRVDKTLWDQKTFEWKDKPFIKGTVRTFFYMPMNIGKVMGTLTEIAAKAGADFTDMLALSDHRSFWTMDEYVAVDRPVDGVENATISGNFYCRLFEGDYGLTGKWTEEIKAEFAEKGWTMGKMYMWYATCPRCAKKYGTNTVGIFTEVV